MSGWTEEEVQRWLARYDRECQDKSAEGLRQWTARVNHEEILRLLYTTAVYFERCAGCEALRAQAYERYGYYRDLYEREQYVELETD